MEAWRSSYTVEARKSSYIVEVRRVVLSMLGCIEYHQRSLHRGDVPTLWKCGKGSYTVDVRAVLSMLGCIDYHKRSLQGGSVAKFLHRGSEEGCIKRNEFGDYPKVKVFERDFLGAT